MGLIPPFLNNVKKNADLVAGGTPYIQYKYMYYKIYKFPNPVHAKRTETPYLTYTPQYISNTKIYIQVTIFPNDWQFTSNTNIYIQLTNIPKVLAV